MIFNSWISIWVYNLCSIGSYYKCLFVSSHILNHVLSSCAKFTDSSQFLVFFPAFISQLLSFSTGILLNTYLFPYHLRRNFLSHACSICYLSAGYFYLYLKNFHAFDHLHKAFFFWSFFFDWNCLDPLY